MTYSEIISFNGYFIKRYIDDYGKYQGEYLVRYNKDKDKDKDSPIITKGTFLDNESIGLWYYDSPQQHFEYYL